MKITKKLICFIIAALFVFAAGCGANDGEQSAPDGSADISEATDQSEEPTESSQDENGPTADALAYMSAVDAALSGTQSRDAVSRNILRGVSYKASVPAHESYPDTKQLLTDGVSPLGFDKTSWCGYNKVGKLIVDFDLGEEVSGILDFSADVLKLNSYGIQICGSVTYAVAKNDGEFTEVGRVYAPTDLDEDLNDYFSLKLQGSVTARYIRVTFNDASGAWLFVGEISAFAYSDDYEEIEEPTGIVKSSDYYGYTEVPYIETPEYWDSSESDYKKEINLVSGLSPMIFADSSFSEDIATDWYNSQNFKLLTNGQKASTAAISDTRWMHFTRGDGRTIVFDLGKTSAVKGFTAGFLKDTQPGVRYPRFVRFAVSENGRDWQTVSSTDTIIGSTAASEMYRLEETFKKTYKARYVKLTFIVDTHTYVDEIEVFGTKDASKALDLTPDAPDDKDSLNGSYITPEDFDGVHNVMLSYHCIDTNGVHDEKGLITVEEYLPYVAYLDDRGNITDTFFDGFLFLPYTSFNYSANAKNANGWNFYVDDIYYENRNMAALDECVGNVKGTLSIPDYKVSVYTSILYTFPTIDGKTNNYGDIDGDGIDEDMSNINDRKKVIKWLMDQEYNRFKAGKYENLVFRGFYWFEESIDYSDPHEPALIKYASDYAHKLGTKLFWIPYNHASGYGDWQALGFDLACMQPNYMFNQTTSEVLYANAEITRLMGMCVEMELTSPTNRSNAAKYTEYMVAGAETGYMYAVKFYYQDGVPGAFSTCCYSEDGAVRKLYDDTYLYAKEKYAPAVSEDITLPEGTELTFTGERNGKISGKIDLGEYSELTDALKVAVSPKYGSLQINRDGSFVYRPLKGFVGTETFSIYIDLGYVSGAETEVTVIIE